MKFCKIIFLKIFFFYKKDMTKTAIKYVTNFIMLLPYKLYIITILYYNLEYI